MPDIVTPEDMLAVTAPFLDKIAPDAPVPMSREQELEAENARLRHCLDEVNAKNITLQSDIAMALDALKEIVSGAQYTVMQIFGAEIV